MGMDKWAEEEFGTAEPGDARLTKRLVKVGSEVQRNGKPR